MNCPKCGDNRAYIGFNVIECANIDCQHFSQEHYDRLIFGDLKKKNFYSNDEIILEDSSNSGDFTPGPHSQQRRFLYTNEVPTIFDANCLTALSEVYKTQI